MSYATLADMRAYLAQVPAGAANDTLLQSTLDRATQVIDTDLGFAFGAPTLGTATVFGDGTDYLKPPTFVAGTITLITTLSGFTVPSYVVQGPILVVTRNGQIAPIPSTSVDGWLDGVPYTISATFGYATVPKDIVECCLEIAIRIWRGKDAGFSDVVGIEGSGAVGYNGAFPAAVKRILNRYKDANRIWVY